MDFTVPVLYLYADDDIGDNRRFVFHATVFVQLDIDGTHEV